MSITGAVGAQARPLGLDEDDLRLLAAGIDVRQAMVDLKFTKSLYFMNQRSIVTRNFKALPGASYTGNAGLLTRVNSAGLLLPPGPANEPGETDAGMDVWEARTNKCTNVTFNPTDASRLTKFGDAAAVLSVVDDSVALAAAGLAAICTNGKVFKLDNSAGVAEAGAACWGQAGNVNANSNSAYIRGGSGSIRETWNGQGVAFTTAATYRRVVAAAVSPGNATSEMSVRAGAGQIVYFILNAREEAASSSPYIPTTTAAATRTAISPVITGLSSILTRPFTAFVERYCYNNATAGRFALLSDGTTQSRMLLSRNPGGLIEAVGVRSGVAQGSNSGATVASGVAKAAVRVRAAGYRLSAQGVLSSGETAATMDQIFSRIDIGSELGSSLWANGQIRRVLILPDMSDAALAALTA